jgi:hypothetical protein
VLVVEDVAEIAGGAKEAYLEAVRTKLAPLAERRVGGRLLFLGSTIGSTGAWPEAITLLELDGWEAWGAWTAALASEADAEILAWREECAPLRERSRHRTLVGVPGSPALADLRRREVEVKAYAFTRYTAVRGRARELADALAKLAETERGAGRELVGLWEEAFAEGEITAVWGHRDLAALAASAKREGVGGELVASMFTRWAFSSPGGPLWPRGEATDVKVW